MVSLEDLHAKYVKAMPEQSKEFIQLRRSLVNGLIKQIALQAAPCSTFEEEVTK